jgi:hypothetical protein
MGTGLTFRGENEALLLLTAVEKDALPKARER